MPRVIGIVGLGEAHDVADVLGGGFVVLGGFPLDGNAVFRDLDYVQFLAEHGRSIGVGLRLQGLGGHAAVVQGILGHVAGLVESHHVEGVLGIGFQVLEGELADILRFVDDVPRVIGIVGLGKAHDVADVLRRRLIVGGGIPLDVDGRLGDTCHLDRLVGDRGCLCVGSECLSRHASIINRVLGHLAGLVVGLDMKGVLGIGFQAGKCERVELRPTPDDMPGVVGISEFPQSDFVDDWVGICRVAGDSVPLKGNAVARDAGDGQRQALDFVGRHGRGIKLYTVYIPKEGSIQDFTRIIIARFLSLLSHNGYSLNSYKVNKSI